MKSKGARRASFVMAMLILAADFISKTAILAIVGGERAFAPWGRYGELFPRFAHVARIGEYFNISLVWNTGVSFSMFSGSSEFNRWALVAMSLAVIRFIYKMASEGDEPLDTIGFSMVIAGAVGNVLDRIRFGAVVDFLDFHIGRYHWPAFNIADIAICIGVAVLIWRQLFRSK